MSQPRRFNLFNCDNIYELSVVEDLLNAAKAKLGFEFSVEKHNFTLSEMSELSTTTFPEMQMDFAMLVVHANESVLYINNDNLELGYAKVYRALMQAAGGNVIVVIGGDDHYKDETEEEQSVISRWAWRKIAHSQFKEEFIDGRKSFVFSWNKKHRAIHEEALLHYFDPNKKGQKFVYQPPQRSLEPETERGPAAKVTEPGRNAPDEGPEKSSSSCESIDEMGNNARRRPTGETQAEAKLEMRGPGQTSAPAHTVMLNTRLRNGRISNRPEDVVYWKPGWVVPDYIEESLLRQHSKKAETELVVLSDEKGRFVCHVNEKKSSHQPYIAPGEVIKLKTRMYQGRISFQDNDVEIFDRSWQVPQEIVDRLKTEYRATPTAKLLVVSDSKDNLRYLVQVGVFNKMLRNISDKVENAFV